MNILTGCAWTMVYFAVGAVVHAIVVGRNDRLTPVYVICWPLIALIIVFGVVFYAIPVALTRTIREAWDEYKSEK